MTGALTLDGHDYYFRANGAQVKGEFVTENGKISYYTVDNGYKVKDKFFEVNGKWYHADKDGNLATGRQTIDHLNYYFNADGSQVKSDFFTLDGGKTWYYAKDNGEIVTGAYSVGGKTITSKKMVVKSKATLLRMLTDHFLTMTKIQVSVSITVS